MNEAHVIRIAQELDLNVRQVHATATLLADGGTTPFIARYRKEATGSLDEVAINGIRDRLERLAELDKRRAAILESLGERGLLTDELQGKVEAAETMAALEDIYLPYRPKRRTRAMVAKEKGLEPLADLLWAQDATAPIDPLAEAAAFVDAERGVECVEDALAGARDILAERVSENEAARASMRELFARQATVRSRVAPGKEEEGTKFRDYFEWQELAADAPSHRILAMFRGAGEDILTLRIEPDSEVALGKLNGVFVTGATPASEQVAMAVEDGYKRLLAPSMEIELRAELKRRADEEAIRVFAENVRELLLAPPLGQKRVLAIDPGLRTGCKVVCLDAQGKLLCDEVIHPHTSGPRAEQAGPTILALCNEHQIEAVAIGNGTASRETEAFVRGIGLPDSIAILMVSESGASVYSASDVARAEFPEHDVTVRGAVSIGRRLMDPLAELVKIDPKAIGVGQYQHDVDQKMLRHGLDDVVMSCVNGIGVDVNTASKQLLTYVSGLGPQLAGGIVAYRDANGSFSSRAELLSVPRLGPKAFEQCAGFLRIRNGANPLDASAVHPESYPIVDAMSRDLECSVDDLIRETALRERIQLERYITDNVGLPTLHGILHELAKPGRDPREQFEAFAFAEGVTTIGDLKPGMQLPGIVTNVTRFGAFVDIGVHQDGLVHISQLADRFVKDPAEVVKVHQRVTVTVREVDLARSRIALSMRQGADEPRQPKGPAAERPGRSPGERDGRSPGERDGRSPGERSGRSPGERSGRSPGERSGRSPGERCGRSPGERSGRSPGERSGRSPGERSGRSPGERSGRSPGERDGRSSGSEQSRAKGGERRDTRKKASARPQTPPPEPPPNWFTEAMKKAEERGRRGG